MFSAGAPREMSVAPSADTLFDPHTKEPGGKILIVRRVRSTFTTGLAS